jgi:predicted phosphate transport protein (TIGR00153 family)
MSINTFFQKLVPVEKKFFPMFESMSETIVKASAAQLMIFEHDDPVKQKDLFKLIKELEIKGDEIKEKIFDDLDKSFIPPFDREDINHLTTSLDEVINMINGVAQRIRLYRPKEIPNEFKDFAKLISKAGEQINIAIKELNDLKKPNKILKACKKISELEKESDDLYHSTISNIFKKEKDAIELIKQKEMLENMEKTADGIKEVSNIIKTIILKGS